MSGRGREYSEIYGTGENNEQSDLIRLRICFLGG